MSRTLDAHYVSGLIDVNGNKKPSFEVYKNLQYFPKCLTVRVRDTIDSQILLQ